MFSNLRYLPIAVTCHSFISCIPMWFKKIFVEKKVKQSLKKMKIQSYNAETAYFWSRFKPPKWFAKPFGQISSLKPYWFIHFLMIISYISYVSFLSLDLSEHRLFKERTIHWYISTNLLVLEPKLQVDCSKPQSDRVIWRIQWWLTH